MAKVSDGIKHIGGYHEIPLPFRQYKVRLSNNQQQKFKRALWQRKRMLQNQQYRSDYVAFITDMIEKVMQRKTLMNRSRPFPTKYGTSSITECIIQRNRRKSESCSIAALDMVELL